jgi:hypothetical protein
MSDYKVAILWRGDDETRRVATPFNNRYRRVFEELSALGIDARPVVYSDEIADEIRDQLMSFDGVLVWVNPLDEGRTREVLDRNGNVDVTKPYIATKWTTIFYFRFWPLGTYRAQVVDVSAHGVPFVAAVLKHQYRILEQLPWTSNKGHIIRSLIVSWGLVALILWWGAVSPR